MKTTRQAILDQQALNRKIYANDTRYEKVWEQIELLGIQDVTTNRQHKNGTRVWRLPIKVGKDKFIEVASFKTGYVRNQNGGYTNYQINKRCDSEPQYYPDYEWCDEKNMSIKTGKFYQYTTRSCVLIPNEIDRLEYLIAYCLKNYYIKNANQVAEGTYVSKWYHEYELEKANETYSENTGAMHRIAVMKETQAALEDLVIDLKAQLHLTQEELAATKVRQDVSVIVNGHRYKVL